MKKTFEFILMIIIFYGIFEALDRASNLFFEQLETVWTVLIALIFSALILFAYNLLVQQETKKMLKKDIDDLKVKVKEKDDIILHKDEEIKNAQSFKENLIEEAESTISKHEE